MTRVQRSVSDPCWYGSCYLSQCGPGSGSRLCTCTFSLFHHIEKSASIDCCKAITCQAAQKTQQQCHHEANFIGELLYILHLVHRCLRTRMWLIFKTEAKNITNLQYLHFHTFPKYLLIHALLKEMRICAFAKEMKRNVNLRFLKRNAHLRFACWKNVHSRLRKEMHIHPSLKEMHIRALLKETSLHEL